MIEEVNHVEDSENNEKDQREEYMKEHFGSLQRPDSIYYSKTARKQIRRIKSLGDFTKNCRKLMKKKDWLGFYNLITHSNMTTLPSVKEVDKAVSRYKYAKFKLMLEGSNLVPGDTGGFRDIFRVVNPVATPAYIDTTNIAPEAVDVAVDTAITVSFVESMDPSTINTDTFLVTIEEPAAATNPEGLFLTSSSMGTEPLAAPSQTVAGTVAYDEASNTATFTPASNLAGSTRYTVSLVGMKNAGGNVLAPYIWSFTTEFVLSVLPGDINNDEAINLTDSILALKVLSLVSTGDVFKEADVNSDNKIGLEEAIYTLQVIADPSLRP